MGSRSEVVILGSGVFENCTEGVGGIAGRLRVLQGERRIATLHPVGEDSLRLLKRLGLRCPEVIGVDSERWRGVVPSISVMVATCVQEMEEAVTAGVLPLCLSKVAEAGTGKVDGILFNTLEESLDWIARAPSPVGRLHQEIATGVEAIQRGGVVAFPTETVYGLGADGFNPAAVKEIFRLKGRPVFNPLILHLADAGDIGRVAMEVPGIAVRLAERFWPGPLTLVLKRKDAIPTVTTAGNPTVAVRVPRGYVAGRLLKDSGCAIAAPSANRSGKVSPTSAHHVARQLGHEGYHLVDGGGCLVGVESTVLSLVGKTPRILRHGGISLEELGELIGPVEDGTGGEGDRYASPGMMTSHYAPEAALRIVPTPPERLDDPSIGLLLFGHWEGSSAGPVEWLSRTGDLEEAARNLYAAVRRLDRAGVRTIYAPVFAEEGLGRALNDRLSRAKVAPGDSRPSGHP